MSLIEASRSGAWVAYCHAESDTDGDGQISVSIGPQGVLSGDRMNAFVWLARGRTLPIDSLAASDASGRWLVVLTGGKLTLIDAASGAETDLEALDVDARWDQRPHRPHRALAFTKDGRKLVYLRRQGPAQLAVVRDLTSGEQTLVTPLAGSVWRVETEPLGAFVVLHQVETDSDADGRLRWPSAEAAPLHPCARGTPVFEASAPRGDAVSVSVAPLGGGSARRVDGFVVALSAGNVVREADGRLVLLGAPNYDLTTSSCGARVLHADPTRNLLVVACSALTGRPPLELVGPALRLPLGVDVSYLGHDAAPGNGERLLAIYPGSKTALVDLEKRRLVELSAGDTVVTTAGSRALVRRGERLIVVDVETNIDTMLPGKTAALATALSTERIGVVAPHVVDTRRGRLLGTISGTPLAVTRDGRVLVAAGADADAGSPAVGPLEWRAPSPAH